MGRLKAPLLVVVTALALVACRRGEPGDADARARTAARTESRGDWTLMRFLGGPPEHGQITDTVRLDPAGGSRRVRIQRSRAGVPPDQACEADAPDGPGWAALLAAMTDPDLEAALAHPERMPLLVI